MWLSAVISVTIRLIKGKQARMAARGTFPESQNTTNIVNKNSYGVTF
jgi:hypothetical protein